MGPGGYKGFLWFLYGEGVGVVYQEGQGVTAEMKGGGELWEIVLGV